MSTSNPKIAVLGAITALATRSHFSRKRVIAAEDRLDTVETDVTAAQSAAAAADAKAQNAMDGHNQFADFDVIELAHERSSFSDPDMNMSARVVEQGNARSGAFAAHMTAMSRFRMEFRIDLNLLDPALKAHIESKTWYKRIVTQDPKITVYTHAVDGDTIGEYEKEVVDNNWPYGDIITINGGIMKIEVYMAHSDGGLWGIQSGELFMHIESDDGDRLFANAWDVSEEAVICQYGDNQTEYEDWTILIDPSIWMFQDAKVEKLGNLIFK